MGTAQAATASTLAYYDKNASTYAESTANVEFSHMRDKFLALLSPAARILDFGSGSGRDARAFADKGYRVTAVDGSAELCRIASERLGAPVRQMLFQELDELEAYDGIWACSSILHLRRQELADVLSRMRRALACDGVIYTSFKLGDFEGERDGRHFTDFTEASFRSFLEKVGGLDVVEAWTTDDVRPGRGDERWLNLLLRKK